MLVDEVGYIEYTGAAAYKKGRTFEKEFTFDGAYWGVMTGVTFEACLKKNVHDEEKTDLTCSFNSTTGKLKITFPNETVDLLPDGNYILDITMITADLKPYSCIEGKVQIKDT
jgi:hypothetical protein